MATPLIKVKALSISRLGPPDPGYPAYSYYRSQSGWKGHGSERSEPLSYYGKTSVVRSAQLLSNGVWTYWSAGSEPYSAIIADSGYQALINQAWNRLWGKIHGDTANLGETLGEIRESSHMIANRLENAHEIAKRDFRRFRRISKRLPKRIRVFADWWLEFQFGWKPLVTDITSALKVMGQDPLPPKKYKAKAGRQISFRQDLSHMPLRIGAGVQSVQMGCYARVENPNRVMLNRLGLANPVLTAWNLTPWSFVADWLFDVSTFLGSFTDSFGYDISRAYTSVFQKGSQSQDYVIGTNGPSIVDSVVLARETSLSQPFPNLALSANLGNSLIRATNAAALLVQLLSKSR